MLNFQRWIISILVVLLYRAVNIFDQQRNEALTQANVAFSRQLAAQALAEVEKPLGNDEFAALLAIRSLKIQYDPIADAAMMEAGG